MITCQNRPVSSADPRPRWQQVADELADGIKAGTYPPGSVLPSKAQMRDRFGISDWVTARVWRHLDEVLGLVDRQQGRGVVVTRSTPVDDGRPASTAERLAHLERLYGELADRVAALEDPQD